MMLDRCEQTLMLPSSALQGNEPLFRLCDRILNAHGSYVVVTSVFCTFCASATPPTASEKGATQSAYDTDIARADVHAAGPLQADDEGILDLVDCSTNQDIDIFAFVDKMISHWL